MYFFKDTDLEDARDNGICTSIENGIKQMLTKKQIDTHLRQRYKGEQIVTFSSRETLDRDYKGNLFYYYKQYKLLRLICMIIM